MNLTFAIFHSPIEENSCHEHFKTIIEKNPLVRWAVQGRRNRRQSTATKHGPEGIKEMGHRQYVGGCWDEIGRLQFDYLVSQGLRPNHYLLDIACGSLRAGIHFIPYLEPGHYLGDRQGSGPDPGRHRAGIEPRAPRVETAGPARGRRFRL